MYRESEKDTMLIAEAVSIVGEEDPDLEAYRRYGFPNVGSARTDANPELIMIYLIPDLERYTLEPNGSVATLYIGRRYDAETLEPKGPPKRSNDPEDLRQWWLATTGYPSSSTALTHTHNSKETYSQDHG